MIPEVVDAKYLGGHSVWLRFADGVAGVVDLGDALSGEVFDPLRDPDYFAGFRVENTLTWPNGADFAPEFLYGRVTSATSPKADPR